MDTPVSCPVCTLYLREGVSLQNHLNTHPKDQVIEALLKFCSSVRDPSAQSDVENVVDGQYLNQQNEQSVTESSVPSISSQQQYPCSSSHFTAAVTYQQFMSSNASVGGTVLPQCFSVPAIITTPAGEPGQATLMPLLYNPYVIQQQQQQLQFYNAVRTLPQQPLSRQIVSPSPLFPISPQFSVAASGNPIYQTTLSSNSALQSGDNVQSNSTIFVPPVNSDNEDNSKYTENDNETNEYVTKCKENVKHSPKKAIQSIQNQEVGSETEVVISKNNECNSPILPIVYEDINDIANLPVIADAKDDPSTSIVYENVCVGKTVSSSKPDGEESCSSENDAGSNIGDTISNPISPGLRVRADLGRIRPNSRDSFTDGRNSNSGGMCGGNDIQDDNGGTSLSNDKSVEDEGWEFLSQKENGNTEVDSVENDGSESSEYITSDLYPSQMEPINSDQPTEQTCEEQGSEMAARHFKVVDIEGMQVLVASHVVSTEDNNPKVNTEFPVRTPSEHFSSGDTPTDSDEVNAAANPDIQTDEVMPAMGELSGQESIGENDTNSWSQEKDDITTSYDLLAREKWEVSDGSDEENDGDINESMAPEDCDVRPVEVTPLPTASSVEEQYVQEKSNKKEKPKCFYKCWICNQIFTCPKERRVHQSEKHAARTKGTKVENLKSTSWSIIKNEENQPLKDTMKHLSEEKDDKVCVKSEIELLPSIPEEINENKIPVEGKSKTFDEECVNELKSIEEPSKPEEDAFKFICSRCEGVFASAKSLHRHVRTAHGQSQFTCRTCGEKYPSEATYLAHLKIHPLECSRCGKYFYRHQNLNLHIRRHLGIKPFKCTICDKAFVTKQKLAEHTNTHTGDTPIKCNLCTETFRRYSNLIQHKNRHHLKIKKKVKDFICHCGEVFHSQKKLHWHKEIHDEKPKTCSYCSERFVHASSLTRHIRKAHDQRYFPCQGRESENVECPICGCIFLKSSLPVHMRLHSGERPFNCHICGKNFSTKWNLQLHRWTHASRSLKPYKCSLCKSAFIRHSEYTSHMHSHRNVRPYTCNYCGSQFIRKYNCIRHAREHESEKPFTCNICQKSFHRRYYLKEHMRIHSGLRPFTCHICGKTSSTKSNHNKHVKIHHAREAVNTEG